MSECIHELGRLQNIIVSRTFRVKCPTCSVELYREHNSANAFLGPLFTILLISILAFLFISFTWFIYAVSFTFLAIIFAYIWDVKKSPLKVYTTQEKTEDKTTNIKALLIVAALVTMGIIHALTT